VVLLEEFHLPLCILLDGVVSRFPPEWAHLAHLGVVLESLHKPKRLVK
jgi:hypothetical protein